MTPTLFGPQAERTAGPRSRSLPQPLTDSANAHFAHSSARRVSAGAMISTDETGVTPAPTEGLFRNGIGGGRIRGERRLRKIEFFGRHCAEKSVDAFGANFDVVVEKQDRLIAQEQIRPQLEETSNGGCFGSRLNNRNVGLRMDVALVVVVEENVISTRLFKVGCVESPPALDEDKDVAIRMARFAFDAQLASGIEAILARPQFLAD